MKSLYISIIAASFFVLPVGSSFALPDQTPHFQLSDMAAYGNNVYLAYRHNGINFVRGVDAGQHFGKPFLMNDFNTTDLWPPQLATSGNHLYISWAGRTAASSDEQVSFRTSTDNGSTFTDPVVLSGNHTFAQLSQLIASGSHVYVTMSTEDAGNGSAQENVLFRASSDNGTAFSNPTGLLPNPTHNAAFPPQVLIMSSDDGKTINVIGENAPSCSTISYGCQNQIFFEKSTDFGSTFSAPKIIYTTTQYISDIHAVASKDSVYLVWGEGLDHVYYMKSDNGTMFSQPTEFFKDAIGKFLYPSLDLAVNGPNVYVAWGHVSYNNPPTLFLVKSNDGGNSFGAPVNLTRNYGYGTFDLKTSGSSLYLTWSSYQHKSEKTDILFEKSSDNGTTFGNPINLSTNIDEDSMNPRVTAAEDNVYVGWGTYFPGDYLVIGSSNDNGANFTSVTDLASTSQTIPEFPFAIKRICDQNFDHGPTLGETIGNKNCENPTYQIDYHGEKLVVTNAINKTIFKIGENITVVPELTNMGNRNITISYCGLLFATLTVNQSEKIVAPQHAWACPLFSHGITLAPNVPTSSVDSYGQSVILNTPGNYTITSIASFGDNSNQIILWSKPLQITVVPEFPFAIPVLVIGITSLVIFTRLKFR